MTGTRSRSPSRARSASTTPASWREIAAVMETLPLGPRGMGTR